ncbi:MAG: peptide-methionine (R)-S-oxide reductase MsrB [Legionella sp.]|nr:peptide-methionine (R)-S-oxide reductase MsrB [Legionella sp.]
MLRVLIGSLLLLPFFHTSIAQNGVTPAKECTWCNKTNLNKLTPLQYEVTQKAGTELPFKNPYWNNKKDGIYVDIVSGEPLFSSTDQYSSGTGWPSFTKPIDNQFITLKAHRKFLFTTTEVRSKHANSHLGDVFNDGPQPGGQRYCINSAALEFIPKEQMIQRGYGAYLFLFNKK